MVLRSREGQERSRHFGGYGAQRVGGRGLDEEFNRRFWEALDEMVRSILPTKKLFIGGDFNGHIGSSVGGYSDVYSGFNFSDRNGGGTSLLDFARSFELVIVNSMFSKREEHLVTFRV
uniref:Uncharacterized protein LOC104237990 n=1 Tax=Nicotiana sylvestris TaxID=4096 RepID=A0A1U7XLQ9_NICSY|nr:PREDICTED: uncharacterized protein LOC104237990 [Nicotiana sylvestris]